MNTKRFNALLYEEPEIVSIVNAGNLDKEGNLNTIPTDPFVGEIVTGELQPSQLTNLRYIINRVNRVIILNSCRH